MNIMPLIEDIARLTWKMEARTEAQDVDGCAEILVERQALLDRLAGKGVGALAVLSGEERKEAGRLLKRVAEVESRLLSRWQAWAADARRLAGEVRSTRGRVRAGIPVAGSPGAPRVDHQV